MIKPVKPDGMGRVERRVIIMELILKNTFEFRKNIGDASIATVSGTIVYDHRNKQWFATINNNGVTSSGHSSTDSAIFDALTKFFAV